jgi:Xaa-Pro aminopeptidase
LVQVTNQSPTPEYDVSEEHPISEHWVWQGKHRPPMPRQFAELMTGQWDLTTPPETVHPGARFAAERRRRLAEAFPGKTLIIPTGGPKVRANDTDYPFRAGTDFFYLTNCHEPDCVLVISPNAQGSSDTLYIARRRDHQTHEFFTDSQYGELWVGARRGVVEAATHYAIATAPLENLEPDLATYLGAETLVLRGIDDRVDRRVPAHESDHALAEFLGEMRLVKDSFEVAQLEEAVAHTVKGFEDVVRALPAAKGRGERVIEGIFALRARVEGNAVGYSTIAASGANATVLHWVNNDGPVRDGDLLLLDAGVECNNLYTADVTRTMPINGTFSPEQRTIYELVYEAQEAGIAAVKPGANFRAPHKAAMRVLVAGLIDLGILKGTLDEELDLTIGQSRYRRYTLHGTSHMLGLDVHDCNNARNELYLGDLQEGYVITVEPGLYFQHNDLTVPAAFRGIGVRIEDDVLVTSDGCRNLSAALPRRATEIEEWMRAQTERGVPALGL